jgi:hypothetical protein
MKKTLLAVAILLSVGTYAQKFQLGAKAGVNISNFTGGDFDAVKKKALIGFHGGLYLRFSFLKFSIQPEMMISTQGATIDSVSGGSYDWKVTYATIPVMLQYKFSGGFFVEGGPQVAFKISDNIEDESIGEFAKNLDLSLAAGLGYRGKKGFGIGGRYTVGISRVGDFQPSSGIDPDFKNGVIQFSLYIPLTTGK